MSRVMMRESGDYPPGAEFDPNAPWNQPDAPPCGCPACDWTGDEDDLEPVPTDLRLADGEPDPIGMCPMCGHPIPDEEEF